MCVVANISPVQQKKFIILVILAQWVHFFAFHCLQRWYCPSLQPSLFFPFALYLSSLLESFVQRSPFLYHARSPTISIYPMPFCSRFAAFSHFVLPATVFASSFPNFLYLPDITMADYTEISSCIATIVMSCVYFAFCQIRRIGQFG